ncbi:MAG: hypothetical protein K8S94_17585 [Planctomycetia bacterium]|nr:hypothetical protein [Planctomycetia bacterium]
MMHDAPPRRDLAPPAGVPAGRSRPEIRLVSGGTAVVFSWAGDRWRHVVMLDGGQAFESIDVADGGDPRWPASPPLVEVSSVRTDRGPALLAVGLAGRSHFSASIVPHPSMSDTLLFEIACRLQETPGWLGSTYRGGSDRLRVAADASATALPGTVQWAYTIGPNGLRAVARADAADRA